MTCDDSNQLAKLNAICKYQILAAGNLWKYILFKLFELQDLKKLMFAYLSALDSRYNIKDKD